MGAGWSSTFRFGAVIQMVQNFLNLKFLSNYMSIYKQLEVFETTLPQQGGVKNFAEIAREYLFFVYLIGSLETFVKAESCALIRIDVLRYFHVERFQEVREWEPTS